MDLTFIVNKNDIDSFCNGVLRTLEKLGYLHDSEGININDNWDIEYKVFNVKKEEE